MAINIQPLDSYRIGRTQLPVPCALCGHDNSFDAAECRTCHAPTAIGRCATGDRKKLKPQLIMPLGADGVGKTVYLGMLLDLLNREQDRCEIETCGASSVSIQQDVIRALSQGEFPEATSHSDGVWKWAHLRLMQRARRAKLDVFLSDIAGHALLEEIENPGAHFVIGPMITHSTGVLLVVDAARIAANDKDEEYFARQLVSHMTELREIDVEAQERLQPPKSRRKRTKTDNLPPVAVLLMKGDQCPDCWENPREFVRSKMPAFWAEIHGRIANFEVFVASAVGAVAKRRSSAGYVAEIPLRTEPRGIIDPFRWLIGQALNRSDS